MRLLEIKVATLQEEMRSIKEQFRSLRKKNKAKETQVSSTPLPPLPALPVDERSAQTEHVQALATQAAQDPPQPQSPRPNSVQQTPTNTGLVMQAPAPKQAENRIDMEALRKELSFVTDARLAYIVKLIALKLFTKDELISCSISGKRSARSTNPRPPLDIGRFKVLTQLVSEKIPTASYPDIREKFQNVQKVLRTS